MPRTQEDRTEISRVVKEILDRVRSEGESAVRHYSEKFDGWNPSSFRVTEEQIEEAEKKLSETFIKDVEFAQSQIRNFAELQLSSLGEFERETLPGVYLGQKHIPVDSCGCYVPGGRYPLIASAHMSIITAKVAGVKRIVGCTPPQRGELNPKILYAVKRAGADEVYAIGGVQAIAAMAYGTEDMKPVDMIVGPGNQYVVEAKRQLFGEIGIDLIAGPSEILIIADGEADTRIIAADLLGQCEHDPNARAILISTSKKLAEEVLTEIANQLEGLKTRDVAEFSWDKNGEVVVVEGDEEAASLADEYAPEHLEFQTREPRWFLDRLKNYGSLFLGEEVTVAYSDKTLGPNHILPTLRSSRYTGGLWVGKFLKTVTYQRLTKEGSRNVAPVAERLCDAEGMLAHSVTARMREQKYS
ncbi:MAG: histidinol dehydrogenase [Candidatus Bathyarchaeia archaeon]